MRRRVLAVCTAALAAGVITIATGMTAASPGASAASGRPAHAGASARGRTTDSVTAAAARVRAGICTAPPARRALAARLSADVLAALRGRAGHHGVTVYDTATKVSCYTSSERHFDSASVVKAIILAALLRWHQETGKPLSASEKATATRMITESDNDAATDLWDEVGMTRLRRFLGLAKMTETELGLDGYWGLTQVTAHDELLLLGVLSRPNGVLSSASRAYELRLMAKVIPPQRWGTPAGAPAGVTVHVKNGWLPDGSGWHINSIGAFTMKNRDYMMAVLTDGNPSEVYGIDTVEAVARAVHRDLNGPLATVRG